jgi:hypothetical protein
MSTGKKKKAQNPAPKNSRRARPSPVKGSPRRPEKNKLRNDGSISRQGDGGGRPRKWSREDKLQFMVTGRAWIQARRRKGFPCSIAAFCDFAGVWRERAFEWSQESEELSEAYGMMKQAAEVALLEHGHISRNFVFDIFQLRTGHGYDEDAAKEPDEPEAAPYVFPKQ